MKKEIKIWFDKEADYLEEVIPDKDKLIMQSKKR
jgi:uncharacterized protein YjaG (DUF416 family)